MKTKAKSPLIRNVCWNSSHFCRRWSASIEHPSRPQPAHVSSGSLNFNFKTNHAHLLTCQDVQFYLSLLGQALTGMGNPLAVSLPTKVIWKVNLPLLGSFIGVHLSVFGLIRLLQVRKNMSGESELVPSVRAPSCHRGSRNVSSPWHRLRAGHLSTVCGQFLKSHSLSMNLCR